MITIKMNPERLGELFTQRAQKFHGEKNLSLLEPYFYKLAECMDGCEVDINYIVDNTEPPTDSEQIGKKLYQDLRRFFEKGGRELNEKLSQRLESKGVYASYIEGIDSDLRKVLLRS